MFLSGLILSFIIGATIGSFLNVIIFRYSDDTVSIVKPSRSFCPSCKTDIKWYDNIPIVSYLFLRGKCRSCRSSISIRYFIVEVLTAAFFLLNFVMFQDSLLKVTGSCIITASLIVVFFIDIDTMTISDWNSIFIVIGGLLIVYADGSWLINSITGLVALLFMLLVYFISHKGIGSGDVILIAASSFAIGPFNTIFSIFLASLFGIVYAIASRSSMKTKVPFGPFLAIGIYCSMLFGGFFSSLLEKLYV